MSWARLMACGFRDSGKHFGRVLALLSELGVNPPARVLDYGANWGYGTFQLRDAGYDAAAYEVSAPRAAFGARLGVDIQTDLSTCGKGFAAVYSGHVVEHVPNPLATLREQLALAQPGGYVIGHTPNGGRLWRNLDPHAFHLAWGMVHPVLLTDEFITRNFAHCSPDVRGVDTSELLFILKASGPAHGAPAGVRD